MTQQKRRRKKRTSSDVLDQFIDDSLRSVSENHQNKSPDKPRTSPRKRRKSSQRSKKRSDELELPRQSKPRRKASEASEKPHANRAVRESEGLDERRFGIVEDSADELLRRDQASDTTKMKTIVDLVIGILIACVFIALIIFYVKFDRAEVISGSMEPTLMTNEKVVIMNGRSPKQFNLVVFYPPTKSQDKYVKRVIGLPGDDISYKDDILYINGEMYDEPYLKSNKKTFANKHPDENYTQDVSLENIPGVAKGTTKIPADMYLVLGDNRQNSQDSRFIGLIPKSNIVGVVWKKDPLPQKIKP